MLWAFRRTESWTRKLFFRAFASLIVRLRDHNISEGFRGYGCVPLHKKILAAICLLGVMDVFQLF